MPKLSTQEKLIVFFGGGFLFGMMGMLSPFGLLPGFFIIITMLILKTDA